MSIIGENSKVKLVNSSLLSGNSNPYEMIMASVDLSTEESLNEAMMDFGIESRESKFIFNTYNELQNKTSDTLSESEFEGRTREPIGWVTVSTDASSPFWYYGFEYNDSMIFSVSTVTNMGQGDWAAEVTGTTPVLPEPTDLVVTAGPQVVDNYEFANLSWAYPTFEPAPYPNCTGTLSYIADGDCDTYNNNPECGWDGGDCCESTCVETEAYDCTTDTTDNDNDGCWDVCYNPDTACGDGIPTCNDDYQFGAIVTECVSYSNSIQLLWNSGCSGSINMNGTVLVSNTSSYSPPVNVINLDPSTEYLFEFLVDGEVVASEVETTSDEDCDADVVDCAGTLSYIGDGWCDSSNNNSNCMWDGGDCCPNDCTDGTYSCSLYAGDCDDCANPSSADLAEGGECYVPPCTGIEVTLSSVPYPNGYDSELSWTIFDDSSNSILSMSTYSSLPYEGCLTTLPAGWYVELNDSANDGWDGQVLMIGATSFTLPYEGGGGACFDSSGALMDCPVDPNATPSCYESYVGSCGAHSDCSDGYYCYYSSWSGSHYCSSNSGYYDCCYYDDSIDTDCDGDTDLDDCPQDCSVAMSIVGFKNHSIHANFEGEDKIDNSISDGYQILTDYQVKIMSGSNPNAQNYRAALGFNVYRQQADGTWSLEGSTTDAPTFQITANPIGCYAVSAYDNDPAFESGLSATVCLAEPSCPITGDVTQDGLINVSDIVYLVNSILGSGLDAGCADMNGDGSINVSDVVALVNVILNPRTASADDASETVLLISENSLKLESNGFVQGLQMTLSHDAGFEIELSDAYVSEYKTMDNQTTLMIVTDGSHSIDEIATFSGDVIIESVHVVNQSGDVTVEETVEIANFEVKVTGPNPFNPSTQLNIVVPEAGFVSVNVYNILGQKVATLVDGYMDASSAGHMVNFNASHLASGVYLVRAVTANDVATQKLMLLK
jgi:regulation of enolase protein 1 (concanavalin A-like superfamily)